MYETGETRLRARMASELDALREEAQFRTLQHPVGINLCSNDYLGLASDPRLKHAVLEGVGRVETVGSTGSRLLSGNAREWENMEEAFASFAGTEAALYFSSGYSANVGLMSSLLKPGDLAFSDTLNHASIIDGIRLSGARKVIYHHCDLENLEQALHDYRAHQGAKLIVTESVFSMEGDVAPIDGLLRLARSYGAELVIDEAHATGVFGPQGRGIVAGCCKERELLAVVHTCGKALASAGAVVCCGNALKHYLINHARSFIFSTAAPPYLAHQIRAAVGIACQSDDRREHVSQLASALRAGLAGLKLDFGRSTTQIIPVILGRNEVALHVAAQLQQQGFAVKAVRPPTVPPGTARLRLSLNSRIRLEEIDLLIRLIGEATQELVICER